MWAKLRLKTVTQEDLPRIHEASLKILSETGIIFPHEEVLDIFKKHGAKVEGKTVRIPKTMVEDALKTAPSSFRWRGRNDDNSLTIGEGGDLAVHPNAGPVYIQDLDKGRRLALLEDFINIQKLAQASDVINVAGSVPVDPSDVDPKEKHLHIIHETLKNSDKPFIGMTVRGNQARQMLDMTEIAMGQKDFLLNNHCAAVVADPLSPLAYAPDTLESLMEYTKRNQVVFLPPCIMAGVTGPISLIGTEVLQNTEILSGIVLTQLINPGNPVVYSCASQPAYLKKLSFIGGSPEGMLINIAGMQMGIDFYNLPSRTLCGISDAKVNDSQAGYETMQNIMMGVLSGAHILTNLVGVLESIMTTSYEKMIIDQELIRRAVRISQGIDTSDEALSVDVIQEVGPNGSYVTHQNTLEHFRDRWLPTISDWGTYDDWTAEGSEDVVVKANKMYKEILANAPNTLIDSELDKELVAYMKSAL